MKQKALSVWVRVVQVQERPIFKCSQSTLDHNVCEIVYQDNFYIDQSRRLIDGGSVNFDHPESIDFDLWPVA